MRVSIQARTEFAMSMEYTKAFQELDFLGLREMRLVSREEETAMRKKVPSVPSKLLYQASRHAFSKRMFHE